jgi:hypothetical protein
MLLQAIALEAIERQVSQRGREECGSQYLKSERVASQAPL